MRQRLAALVLLSFGDSAARAGSYVNVALCEEATGCLLNTDVCHALCDPDCDDPDCSFVPPFAIVHPFGYTGAETALQVRICLEGADAAFGPTLERAIAMWEALQPATPNCEGCGTWEDPIHIDGTAWAHSVLLHELGHCALGLDHVERFWDDDWDGDFEETNFTRSAEAAYKEDALDDGADNIRGSGDDFHQAFGGLPAESVSWFRQADNDPFIVDATVIDIGTFSRSISNLPPPDTWGASGNLNVALPQGYVDSQVVMFGLYQRQQFYMNLLADDANMLKMARTGVDLMAGTADDYSVDLLYVGDCSNAHDLKVSVDPVPSGAFGFCGNLRIDYSFDPGNPLLARHFSIMRIVPAAPLEIVLNDAVPWTLGEPIFEDGFESGDFSDWSVVTDGSDGGEVPAEGALPAIEYEGDYGLLPEEEVFLVDELGLDPSSSE